MSKTNLTQHAENLKSLQQNLLKICDAYQHAQKSFIDLQAQVRCAWHQVNHAWSQVIDLFVLIDEIGDDVPPQSLKQKSYKPSLWKELFGLRSGETRLKQRLLLFP